MKKLIKFETRINNDDYIVRDHRVHGVRIMPGVTFLDLILRMIRTQGFDSSKAELRNVLFKKPVVTSDSFDKEILLTMEKEGECWKVKAESRPIINGLVSNDPPELNLDCQVFFSNNRAPVKVNLAKLKSEAHEAMPLADMYKFTEGIMINHYTFMKCLGKVYKGEDYLLGEITLSDLGLEYLDYCYLHPAYLDCSTIIPAIYHEGSLKAEKPYIPIFIDKFTAYKSTDNICYVLAMKKNQYSSSEDVNYSSYMLMDENGFEIGSVSRLAAKQIRSESLIKNLEMELNMVDKETEVKTASIEQEKPKKKSGSHVSGKPVTIEEIRKDVAKMVGFLLSSDPEGLEIETGFYDLGLDSTQLLEISKKLESKLGVQLYPTLLFEYSNIAELSDYLLQNHGSHYGSVPQETESASEVHDEKTTEIKNELLWGRMIEIEENADTENTEILDGKIIAIFVKDKKEGDRFKEYIENTGMTKVVLIKPGDKFQRIQNDSYIINPGTKDDYDKLFSLLGKNKILPEKIIHYWGCNSFSSDEDTIAATLKDTIASLTFVTQATMSIKKESELLFLFDELENETANPLYKAVQGFIRSLQLENPKYIYSSIEITKELQDDENLVKVILNEFYTNRKSGEFIRLTPNKRWVRKPFAFKNFISSSNGSILKKEGVYLITGGAGGIGRIFARYLGKQYNARLILTGRSKVDKQKEALLKEINDAGGKAEYYPCDMKDRDSVQALIKDTFSKFDKLDGVFYSAGINRDSMIVKKEAAELWEVMAAKIFGTIFLDELLKDKDLDFFLLFSSISSVWGNIGQSDYAYANSFLDFFAEYRNTLVKEEKRKGKTLSINWPLWADGGMTVDKNTSDAMFERSGMALLENSSGIEACEAALKIDDSSLMVLSGNTDKIINILFPDQKEDFVSGEDSPEKQSSTDTDSEYHDDISFIFDDDYSRQNKETSSTDDVAIIGLSGRYPKSANLEEFWEVVKNGISCVDEVPVDRWNVSEIFDAKVGAAGKTYCKWGSFIKDAQMFDPLFFSITPIEAENMDPQLRILLETSWHAIEDAGYTRRDLSKKEVGVYMGTMNDDFTWLSAEASGKTGKYYNQGTFAYDMANRISYIMNLNGPSLTIETACSSSLTAIHMARMAIINEECDIALAGGVNINLHKSKYITLSSMGIVSPTGVEKTFDKDADGYVPGEGCGVVMLKSLPKALEDKDNIYGIIKGSAVNHSGAGAGHFVPNLKSLSKVVEKTIRGSGVNPGDISYIETHGSGTSLGDALEVQALSNAFRQFTQKSQYCALGSKANIGHLEPVSGICSLTKVLLGMSNQQIPMCANINEINPSIPIEGSPFYIPETTEDWTVEKKYAGVNSYGVGGSNCFMLIEAPSIDITSSEETSVDDEIILFSAKSQKQLLSYAEKILAFLTESQKSKPVSIKEIAYMTQVGRESLDYRAAFIVNNKTALANLLTKYISGEEIDGDQFYKGHRKNQDNHFLVSGGDGASIIKLLIQDRNNRKLARLWVDGIDIDWKLLHSHATPKRQSIPGYPFERMNCLNEETYNLSITAATNVVANDEKQASKQEQKASDEIQPEEPSVGDDKDKNLKELTEEMLKEIVSKATKIPIAKIDPNEEFEDMGIDSIMVMNLIRILENYYGDLSKALFFDYSTLSDLADYFSSQHHDLTVKNVNDILLNKDKTFLSSIY